MDDKRLQEIKARAEAATPDEVGAIKAENARLRAELEAAKRAISSMLQAESYEELCVFCKSVRDEECVAGNCENAKWCAKWCGLCAENGGESNG